MYTVGANSVVAGAIDSDGEFFPLDSLKKVVNRNASGQPITVVASGFGKSWTRTYTYVAGQFKEYSLWVKS
jgi:hypothetical protein